MIGDSGEKDIEIYERIRDESKDQILKVFIRDVGSNQSPQDLELRARKRVSTTSVQSSTSSIRGWMGYKTTVSEYTIDNDVHKRWRLFTDPTDIIMDSDVREYLSTQYRGDFHHADLNSSNDDIVVDLVNSVDSVSLQDSFIGTVETAVGKTEFIEEEIVMESVVLGDMDSEQCTPDEVTAVPGIVDADEIKNELPKTIAKDHNIQNNAAV